MAVKKNAAAERSFVQNMPAHSMKMVMWSTTAEGAAFSNGFECFSMFEAKEEKTSNTGVM